MKKWCELQISKRFFRIFSICIKKSRIATRIVGRLYWKLKMSIFLLYTNFYIYYLSQTSGRSVSKMYVMVRSRCQWVYSWLREGWPVTRAVAGWPLTGVRPTFLKENVCLHPDQIISVRYSALFTRYQEHRVKIEINVRIRKLDILPKNGLSKVSGSSRVRLRLTIQQLR